MVNIHLYIISLLLFCILSLYYSPALPTDAVAADPPSPHPPISPDSVKRCFKQKTYWANLTHIGAPD